jgi:tellurium resistance protein TerD
MGINFGISNVTSAPAIEKVKTETGAITLNLNKGALLDLTKREPGLKNIILGAGWDVAATVPAFDLDISAFLLNANGKITTGEDIVFFNHKSVSGVELAGDNRTGSGDGDDEEIHITLDNVSAQYSSIEFVVNIFDAMTRHQTFGMVNNSFVRLVNADTNKEICRINLKGDYSSSTAVVFACLKRNGSEWEFESICEGKVIKDLNEVAALYL